MEIKNGNIENNIDKKNEILETENIDNNLKLNDFELLVQEKNNFNETVLEKYSNEIFLKPNTMIDFKVLNYDKELMTITFIVPDTKTKLDLQKELAVMTNNQDLKTSYLSFFLMLENKRILRYANTGKGFNVNDIPLSQALELGGYLIQFIIQ